MSIISNQKLNMALEYASNGYRVFPIHSAVNGECSCYKKKDCEPQGKHPRVNNWQNLATTNNVQISKWWEQWPESNIGIATGSNLLVLDVDVKHGIDGFASFNKLFEGVQPFKTYTVSTPSGGRHYYFKVPAEETFRFTNRTGFLPGLDIKTTAGYVVGAGSTINGKSYVAEEI